ALPKRRSVTWYAEYMQDPDDPEFAMTLWVASGRDKFIGFTLGRPDEPGFASMLASMLLSPIGRKAIRPARVCVGQQAALADLQNLLQPLDIQVELGPPSDEAHVLFDEIRPQIILQFMLDAGLAENVDVKLRELLLAAVYSVEQRDPWTRLTLPIGFQVEGLMEQPIALILDRDFESRTLLVTGLGHGPIRSMSQLTERIGEHGVLFVLEKTSILGEEDFWPYLMTTTEVTITADQVKLLLAALEVVCIATDREAEMGNAASFKLQELVPEPVSVEVVRLPAPPGSARRRSRAARHATRTRGGRPPGTSR
ncbi:MAG: hypothetical protein ACYCW6_04730, partial [Candidatus Xenobia bacterium]